MIGLEASDVATKVSVGWKTVRDYCKAQVTTGGRDHLMDPTDQQGIRCYYMRKMF